MLSIGDYVVVVRDGQESCGFVESVNETNRTFYMDGQIYGFSELDDISVSRTKTRTHHDYRNKLVE